MAIIRQQWMTLPSILLLLVGFAYVGWMSLLEQWRGSEWLGAVHPKLGVPREA
jgi:hypothetical protein